MKMKTDVTKMRGLKAETNLIQINALRMISKFIAKTKTPSHMYDAQTISNTIKPLTH